MKWSSEDKMSFVEFQQCLFNLGYLSSLKTLGQNPEMATKNLNKLIKSDMQKSHALLQQLWAILNPYRDELIDRLPAIELLLLLMINISSKPKQETTLIVAKHLTKFYESLCISLQSQSALSEKDKAGTPKNEDGGDSHPNLADVMSSNANPHEEVELFNNYLMKRGGTWKLDNVISAFKREHAQRATLLQHDDNITDRSLSLTGSKVYLRNSSQNSILPSDNRKYKSTSIAAAVENYTFRPKVNSISKKMAKEHYRYIQSVAQRSEKEKSLEANNRGVSNEIISLSIKTGHEANLEEKKILSESQSRRSSPRKGFEQKLYLS